MAWLLAAAACGSMLELGPIRDSALPLSGKRVLLAPPRTEAAPLASALVLSGCRPIWCPAVAIEPLEDYSDLDDALMRLTEYDVLITLCPHSIDAIAQRWLGLADGSTDVVLAMIEASSIEIGAVGGDALHFRRRLGMPASVVPIESSARALAETLHDLGHVAAGARVLVASGQCVGDTPAAVATCLDVVRAKGAEADRVVTHRITPISASDASPELSWLRGEKVDGLCVASHEEMSAIVAACGDEAAELVPKLVVALGQETAACARELAPGATVLELGSRPSEASVVSALEEHFGAGKLLF